MRYFVLIVLIAASLHVAAQGYFVKRVDISNSVSQPNQIVSYQGRLFAFVGHFCGQLECTSILELSEAGDTITRTVVEDIDSAFESMIISNDTITIVGNNDPVNTHFRMAHFDLEGNKISDTYEILHPTEQFTRAFQMTTQKVGNKFYIMGSAEDEEYDYSLLCVVDNQGVLDTLVKLAKAESRSTVWDSDIDDSGHLVTFHKQEQPFGTADWLEVIKHDSSLNQVWKYRSEDTSDHLGFLRGFANGGKVFFSTYTDGANQAKHSIRSIEHDSTEQIIYEPEKVSTNQRAFSKIKVLENGDILGIGAFQDVSSIDPPVDTAPWLIRMSPEGDIRWQRVFYELNPETGESRFGVARDVVELPNGDLFGLGDLKYEFTTTFLFKVDENGCLNAEDCGVLQFITDTETVLQEEDIILYPNPAGDQMQLSIPYTDGLEYLVIDQMGKTAIAPTYFTSTATVDTSSLTSGIYYIAIVADGNIVGSRKFIKK